MAVCIAYFVNLTVPRSGEVSRAVILKKYENVPFDKGLRNHCRGAHRRFGHFLHVRPYFAIISI